MKLPKLLALMTMMILASATFALAVPVCDDTELLVNGGFETPAIPTNTWSVFDDGTSGMAWDVAWVNGAGAPAIPKLEFHNALTQFLPVHDGQYVELDADWGYATNEDARVRISQDIDTIDGATYELQFWYKARESTGPSDNQLEVMWDGSQVDSTIVGTSAWTEYTKSLVGNGGTQTLSFADVGTGNALGSFLDAASLTCVTGPCVEETTLYAGQDMPVGTVYAWSGVSTFYVEIVLDEGFEMTESHVEVGTSIDDFHLNKQGNPKVGHFTYGDYYDPAVSGDVIAIPLGDYSMIAVHAVVQEVEVVKTSPFYPTVVVDSVQGLRKDGTAVALERSTPAQGLEYESAASPYSFFSLGFGGSITADYECMVINGDGDDIRIIEDTWGSYPVEQAEVLVSVDGVDWTSLGTADNSNFEGIHTISTFDLGSLNYARYVKVVDTSDPAVHASTADGYDLNAIEALQDCVLVHEESAWGDGESFPGNNWAMYFSNACYEEPAE